MNRFKNIVTNILGLIFWGFSVYELTKEESDYIYITFLVIVGIVLFRYKWSETKKVIDNILNKTDISSRTVDPDRENPDTRG